MNAVRTRRAAARLERLLVAGIVLALLPALLSASTWRILVQPTAAAALALLALAAGFALHGSSGEPRRLRLLALALFTIFATLLAASALRFIGWLAIYNG